MKNRVGHRIPLVLMGMLLAFLMSGCADPTPSSDDSGPPPASETSATSASDPFVGTWRLANIESRDGAGETIPREAPLSSGYIMYDAGGYMGVVIQGANRQPYAGERRTPEEALAALRSYTSYFGHFSVDEETQKVTHHLIGSLNPSGAGSDYVRGFEFEGNRLTLQPPARQDGGVTRLTWERVPDLEDLTDEHRRLTGFRQLLSIERTNDLGESLEVNQYEAGFIIYTTSGHMAVHLMRPGREPYADSQPTPEEAETALRTYASYFGPYTIHEDEGYLVHHRVGTTDPNSMGSDAQRFYELSDDRLILRPPPRTIDGREVQSALTWARLNESL